MESRKKDLSIFESKGEKLVNGSVNIEDGPDLTVSSADDGDGIPRIAFDGYISEAGLRDLAKVLTRMADAIKNS